MITGSRSFKRIVLFSIVTPILLAVLFSSCVTHKQLKYLDLENSSIDADSLYEIAYEDYHIQPGDLIDIKVRSMDSKSIEVFSNSTEESSASASEAAIYLNNYHVDFNGDINLPIIGKYNVLNYTILQLNDSLNAIFSEYFNVVSIYAYLTSIRITVLGEINAPNSNYLLYPENNILNAIGFAGGFTDYANKTNIKIISKKGNEQKVNYIDLSTADCINSPYFYLKPNDIIYVEPLKAKPLKVNSGAITLITSVLSLGALIITLASR